MWIHISLQTVWSFYYSISVSDNRISSSNNRIIFVSSSSNSSSSSSRCGSDTIGINIRRSSSRS